MNILSLFGVVSPFFRRRRMGRFLKLFVPTPSTRICDIGGYPDFWKELFPGCGILKEKFFLLTKSYIVVRKA
jgi:hypothetical protein